MIHKECAMIYAMGYEISTHNDLRHFSCLWTTHLE